MDEEEIDVVNYDPDPEKSMRGERKPALECPECLYIGRTLRGLNAHRRHKHPKPEDLEKKRRTPNARKQQERVEDEPERVTTKQLLGGRKRPKTVLENVEDGSSARGLPPGLEMVDQDMPVGEYVARRTAGVFLDGDIDDMGGSMIVGEEVVIDGEEEIGRRDVEEMPMSSRYVQKKYIRPRSEIGGSKPARRQKYSMNRISGFDGINTAGYATQKSNYSHRIIHGDEDGKYICYVKDCPWKGAYRSLRMEHMKTCHPDWKMPSRFLLQRISKEGKYINPDDYIPPIPCLVEGCEWRGNYRASRSAHMRKEHKEEHAEIKKRAPGYNSNGTYLCHYPHCTWRGWSRSTRSMHLKREHPEWRPEDSRVSMLLTCFHCKTSLPSYPHLVNHIEQHGGIGLTVDQIFESKDEFSTWLERIEGIYSITFEKSDSVTSSPDFIAYTLHCNCVGGRGIQIAADSRNYIYQHHNFLKRRTHQFLTRSKNDCSAYLEIREDPYHDRITAKGSLEHTGHRFGTPLVRMSPMDRQLYSDVLEIKNHREFRLTALDAVERLNAFEGFTMDNFAPPKTIELIEPLDDDPLTSLRMIVEQSDQTCFFAVDLGGFDEERLEAKLSFGYMSHEMKRYWTEFGPDRVVTIDVNLAEFETIELYQYSVIVTDDNFVPKCAMIYLTTDQTTGCAAVLGQLKAVDPRQPASFMCDSSQIWPETIEKLYRTETDPEPPALISEWSLMEFWASKIEQLVDNEFDIYSLITALRRLLRTEDANQFIFYIVEIFEAFFECGYDRLAEFLDNQLSDVEFFKRWSPCHRNAFTSHGHPTLAVSSSALRNMYLSCEGIERPDQWFAHATKRIDEFNDVQGTQTFTLRPMDGPKKFFYETINMQEFHKQVVEQDAETLLVYEEEVDDGDYMEVVEEEVIGEDEMYEVLEPGNNLEHLEVEQEEETAEEHQDHREEEQEREQEEDPEDQDLEDHVIDNALDRHQNPEDRDQDQDQNQPSASSSTDPPQPSDANVSPPQFRRGIPKLSPSAQRPPRKRDTTRAVIRGNRKRKDRFADLRDCPPEVMRAIAAHAIAYDGRKKVQRPFICMPSEAQLAQSSTPVIPTPDLRPYLGTEMSTKTFSRADSRRTPPSSAYGTQPVPQRKYPQVVQNSGQWRPKAHQQPPPHRRHIDRIDQQPSTSAGPSTAYHHHHHHHEHDEEMMEMVEEDDDHHSPIHHQHEEDDQQPCTSASLYN